MKVDVGGGGEGGTSFSLNQEIEIAPPLPKLLLFLYSGISTSNTMANSMLTAPRLIGSRRSGRHSTESSGGTIPIGSRNNNNNDNNMNNTSGGRNNVQPSIGSGVAAAAASSSTRRPHTNNDVVVWETHPSYDSVVQSRLTSTLGTSPHFNNNNTNNSIARSYPDNACNTERQPLLHHFSSS